MFKMINQVKSFLDTYNLLQKNKVFVVGFSGGYDSMCLLDILNKISNNIGFKLVALHLNHNWRGDEAKREQQNCQNFCEEKNIEFCCEVLPEGFAQTETVAREKRQEFFKKYYKIYNADALFLAHTKSDNTETVLYRLAKGTGVRGLCGILEHSCLENCKIYRPLINFSREDILKYCDEQNLNPNNDSSNTNTKYARNFLRHQIVPELKKINTKLDDVIANLSKISLSEQSIVQEYLRILELNFKRDGFWLTQSFVILSREVQNKFILELLLQNDLEYDSKKVEEIFNFIQANCSLKIGKTLSLTKNLWLFVSKDKICVLDKLKKDDDNLVVEINGVGAYKFRDKVLTIEEYNGDEITKFPDANAFIAYVNITSFENFVLRTRRDGDIIKPFGLNGSMKLKKLFINKGIEKLSRDDIILLCNSIEVLWAIGVCLSDNMKTNGKPTHVLKFI